MHFPLLHRHPELVSGSISPHIRSQWRQAQPHRQVGPMRVRLVDQVDLPRPVPILELLLAGDDAYHVAEHFEVNQPVRLVARGKPRRCAAAVLPHAAEQVGSHADVQRAVVSARQNIDAGVALLPHGPECAAKWTLKQVQGDDERLGFENFPTRRSSAQTRLNYHQLRHAKLVSASIEPQLPTP